MRKIFAVACAVTLLSAIPLAGRAHSELPDPMRFSVALELGDIKRAAAWLEAGLDPNFEGALIGTGLMIGAWEGNLALMELFHRHGADIDYVNRHGETALMLAAWKNRPHAVRWLLAHGAQPNRPERQWSPLHYAAFAGHQEIVELLLAAGADINARSTNGSTVLMMAVREGHAELARRLLAAGADPSLRNEAEEDALQWAMRHGHYALARALADDARFAALARQESERAATPAPRSLPVPDPVDELLRQARLAELEGRRAEALQAYRAAWAALGRVQAPQKVGADRTARPSPPSRTPSALVIRAKRSAPEQQSATLRYAEEPAQSADHWLAQARAAEAAGRSADAIAHYRRAAAAIRAGQ